MDDDQAICDQYGPLVWRVVYRVLGNEADALDCCQDVLWEVAQRAHAEKLPEAMLRWLATRRAIDHLRKRARLIARRQVEFDVIEASESRPGPLDQASYRELIEQLRVELAKLPEQQATAFWLRSIEDLSYDEIAAQLTVPVNTVGVLIHRAKTRLRAALTSFSKQSSND